MEIAFQILQIPPKKDTNMNKDKNNVQNIILLSRYYRGESASAPNELCAASLVKELLSKGFNVDVVCSIKTDDAYNNNNLIIHETGFKTNNKRTRPFFHKLITYLQGDINNKEKRLIFEKCKEICRSKRIDIVIAMFFPFENALAAKRIKERFPTIKFITYELDSVSDSFNSSSFIQNIRKHIYNHKLKGIYKKADKIIIMQAHKEYFTNTFYKYTNKMAVSDIPMLKEPINMHSKSANEKITLIYSGLLDSKYRNPLPLLKAFSSNVLKDIDFKITFFSSGDCRTIVEKHSFNDRIEYKNIVPKRVLDEKIANSDFLLNVGNFNSNSVPSKLIVYLSTGKPIIHFAYNEKDSCLPYLEKYPLSLILFNSNNFELNAKKIKDFIKNNSKKRIEFSVIKSVFFMNVPDYSCDIIVERE